MIKEKAEECSHGRTVESMTENGEMANNTVVEHLSQKKELVKKANGRTERK